MSNQATPASEQEAPSHPLYSVYQNGATVEVTFPDGCKAVFPCMSEQHAKRMQRQMANTIEIGTGVEVVPF